MSVKKLSWDGRTDHDNFSDSDSTGRVVLSVKQYRHNRKLDVRGQETTVNGIHDKSRDECIGSSNARAALVQEDT